MGGAEEKITGVVVTYNRKEWLYRNLEAMLSQTRPPDEIIVVDNHSTDGTYRYISGFLKDPRVRYYRLRTNTGGSGGFSWGVKKAYERGADYIWGMDDDAVPEQEALERLIEVKNRLGDSAALWSNCDNKNAEDEINPVDSWMFVGFFVSRTIIDDVGFPRGDLFIYWDDCEYASRIRKAGYPIYKIRSSVIRHQEANGVFYPEKIIGPLHFNMPRMPDWKMYYYIRNKILVRKWSEPEKYRVVFLMVPKMFLKSFLFKTGQQASILRAWIDGIAGRSGKRVVP